VKCRTSLRSSRAARIVRRCQELPGAELFCYVDAGGATRDLGSGDVNAYLKEITGAPFTAKHFRTWGGSVIAADSLRAQGFPAGPLTQREAKSRQLAAIDAAARELCNTRAVCRKYYVHPAVLQADGDGRLRAAFDAASRSGAPAGLRLPERALLRLLDASPGNGRLHPRNQACPAPKPRTRRTSASVNGSTSRTPTRSRGASA